MFDLHYVIIDLESQFVFLRVDVLHRFYCSLYLGSTFALKMLSAYNICSIYPSAHQTIMEETLLTLIRLLLRWSDQAAHVIQNYCFVLLFIHVTCYTCE